MLDFLMNALTWWRSDIWIDGVLYMKRLKFLPDWMPGFRLHSIVKSDLDRELHCHPFDFVSIILKGGYWEYTADGQKKWYGPGSVIYRKAETLHRLELPWEQHDYVDMNGVPYTTVTEQAAWTFVLRGRHRREWGFQTDNGWVPWYNFIGAGESK